MKIQKMDLLVSIYIFCIAVSELMGQKTFAILGAGALKLNASVAIFVIPIIFTINDVITEVHGAERARSVVRSGFIVIVLLFLYSLLSISLPPSTRFKTSEPAYRAIFSVSARIAAASLTAFALSDFLDIWIFAKLKKRLGKKGLWLRNNVSNIISEFVDTVVFMFLAFYALDKGLLDNVTFLWSLILPYWFLKCVMSIIETPLVYIGVRWLKDEKNSQI